MMAGQCRLVPLLAAGLVIDVSGHVGDLVVGEPSAEGGHGVLAVGHLEVGGQW